MFAYICMTPDPDQKAVIIRLKSEFIHLMEIFGTCCVKFALLKLCMCIYHNSNFTH